MMNEEIHDYVTSLLPKRSPLVLEMEQYAKDNNVPIMELVALEAMLLLLVAKQPKTILEIGTAIGYSAIRMAEALPQTQITTIERDDVRFHQAQAYIQRAGLQDRIHLIHGDATNGVDLVVHSTPFDVLFIDAAKGQYQTFFELYTPKLADSGLVISDNILFRGLVAKEDLSSQPKRLQKLAIKIKRYNEWLSNHPHFTTRILPIGDGMACSMKIRT
ncbi:O-methyltransferase [Shouchella clausii]|uniref:O-methyltransferase n=1 Tax=Shouchella clausii TaxID=79880 RepID=UPI00280B95D2|nr:O-methyltransferase [Shouchella clausii]WMM32276.1 O-methyltransferase [Shouchella clausii]